MKHLYLIPILFVILLASCGSYYLATHGHSRIVTNDTVDVERGYNYTYPNR